MPSAIRSKLWINLVFVFAAGSSPSFAVAEEMSVEEAWEALPKYEYGQDMAALLTIDREVIRAMGSSKTRSACAARLAKLLEDDDTTLAAGQYVCLQLRQVGTSAQVPLLSELLVKPETSQTARYALEAIPGEESVAALRDALTVMKGQLLVGVINSLAARKDVRSLPKLQQLSDSEDDQLASAALQALGNIGGGEAALFLTRRAENAEVPMPKGLVVPLLRAAHALGDAGHPEEAAKIFAKLAQAGQASGTRRAALEGMLRLQGREASTIVDWFIDADPDRRIVASAHLDSLADEQLDDLSLRLADLPEDGVLTLIEVLTSRRGDSTVPLVMSIAQSDKPGLRLAGVRCLGLVADGSAIPFLIDTLSAGDELTEAAQQSLAKLPPDKVGPALLDALNKRPTDRAGVIDVLKKLKYYEAIDPLIAIAAQADPAVYDPALDGLRGIADPDAHDVPRLIGLLLETSRGRHRDEVEKTVLIVCDKLPKGKDRAEPVLEALNTIDQSEAPKYLALLGRLGGPKSLTIIESALGGNDSQSQEAAVRGLCNWPDAKVADRLLDLASNSDNKTYRQWALRAYIRVVSLPDDRPESETLAMLQNAMELADNADDKRLALQRASTVRTMDAVLWIAGYLDDPALSQAACEAIVELAHHRFLRHPNMNRFSPILEKAANLSKDPTVVERAKRYALGL